LTSDGAGSPQKITIMGFGRPGALSLTPNPLNFSDTPLGHLSAPQTLTITNTGQSAVIFSSISLGGANAADFQIASDRCFITLGALSPNGSCTIDFPFNPQAAGARTTTLTVASDGAGSPQTVTLTGNGLAPAATTPRFAYEANPDGTVSIFAVDPATGHLLGRGYAAGPLHALPA